MLNAKNFLSGAVIPVSGMYRMTHAAHELPSAAILMELEKFPTCAQCHGAIRFELVESDAARFAYPPIRLMEIPLMPH